MRNLVLVAGLIAALIAPAAVDAASQRPHGPLIVCAYRTFGPSPRTGQPSRVYICKAF